MLESQHCYQDPCTFTRVCMKFIHGERVGGSLVAAIYPKDIIALKSQTFMHLTLD